MSIWHPQIQPTQVPWQPQPLHKEPLPTSAPSGFSSSPNTGRLGMRGFSDASRNISTFVVGGLGLRGQNVARLGSSANTASTGSVGVRGQNVAVHNIVVPTDTGRIGVRGQNVAIHNFSSSGVGSLGLRGQNVVAPHGINSTGSVGLRGQNVANVARVTTAVASLGLRGQCSVVRAIGAGAQQGRLGVKGQNDASRAIASVGGTGRLGLSGQNSTARNWISTATGSIGMRGRNEAISGFVPVPVAPPPNFAECETDLTLPKEVVWA